MDNKNADNVQNLLLRVCKPATFCAQNKLAGGIQCPKKCPKKCPKNNYTISEKQSL